MANIKHFKIQLTEELHLKLKVYCAKNKLTMNESIMKAIEKIVKNEA